MEQQVCDEPHADEQTKAEDYGNAAQKDTWQRYLCTVAWLWLFTANQAIAAHCKKRICKKRRKKEHAWIRIENQHHGSEGGYTDCTKNNAHKPVDSNGF